MKILVIGAEGQLGKCLQEKLKRNQHDLIFCSKNELDITDTKSTEAKIKSLKPEIIINSAAYTFVDKAEKEKQKNNLINNISVGFIANLTKKINATLIHISTDYVFDGEKPSPYNEKDEPNPISEYGKAKLKGEDSIRKSGCNYFIIRTEWVFSEFGNNFLKTMIKLGEDRNELNVVNDQIGCPTYAQDLAKAINNMINHEKFLEIDSGIYHYSGDRSCSWFEFSKEIFKEAGNMGLKTPESITPISSSDYQL